MRYIIYFWLIQIRIFYDQYSSNSVTALIGNTVEPAGRYEFPYVVCLSVVDLPEPFCFCTGSLITLQHVVTSDHCFYGFEDRAYYIIVGTSDVYLGASYYPWWWISYDQWATTYNIYRVHYENDISVLKILAGIPRSRPVIDLSPVSPISNIYGLPAKLVGWGLMNNQARPNRLQKANTTIISKNNCHHIIRNTFGYNFIIQTSYFCSVGNPPVHYGLADSGGPIIYDGKILGISKGICPPLPVESYPAVVNIHVSVDDYRDFINAMMMS